MKKRLITVILFAIILTSCAGKNNIDTRKIVSEMVKCDASMPSGVIYTTESEPGMADYLSRDMLEIMYGEGEYPRVFDKVESAAIRLSSFAYPGEYAVFLCVNVDTAKEVADLCLVRADKVKFLVNSNLGKNGFGTYEITPDTVRVSVIGKYVVAAVSPVAENSLSVARNILR